MRNIILVLIIFGIGSSMIGCKRTEYNCVKRYWEIKIDGNDTDWPDSCIHYLEKPGQAVCFVNDESYFYLLLRLSDPRTITQIIGQGATIWFEPAGRSRLGIQYPTGLTKTLKNQKPTNIGQKEKPPRDNRRSFSNNREALIDTNLIERAQREMEILIPEKDLKRLIMAVISKSYGIEAKFAYKGESFIYELKLPLNKIPEYEFALNTGESTKINIDIESEAPDINNGPLGGASPTGVGGMQEGGPLGGEAPGETPSGGRRVQPGAMSKMEKIKMKFLVNLSP